MDYSQNRFPKIYNNSNNNGDTNVSLYVFFGKNRNKEYLNKKYLKTKSI